MEDKTKAAIEARAKAYANKIYHLGALHTAAQGGYIAGETHNIEEVERLKNQWISVKDRYPKDYERVLLWDNRDKYPLSVSVGYMVASQTRPNYITHWMELPKSI